MYVYVCLFSFYLVFRLIINQAQLVRKMEHKHNESKILNH